MLMVVSPASVAPVWMVTPGISLTKSCARVTPARVSATSLSTVTEAGTSESFSFIRRAVTVISLSGPDCIGVALGASSVAAHTGVAVIMAMDRTKHDAVDMNIFVISPSFFVKISRYAVTNSCF
jgi:hypothetical protein